MRQQGLDQPEPGALPVASADAVGEAPDQAQAVRIAEVRVQAALGIQPAPSFACKDAAPSPGSIAAPSNKSSCGRPPPRAQSSSFSGHGN